ncbi:MAG: hypothetical protein R3B33_15595 [Nitrospirales bacterium]
MHQIISRYVVIVSFGMVWLGPAGLLPAQPTDTTEAVLELVPLIQEAIQQNPEIASTQEQVLAGPKIMTAFGIILGLLPIM